MKNFLCALLATFASLNFQAQTLPPLAEEQAEDAYIPDTLIEVRNAIKIDPLLILKGEMVLVYERAISNHFSAEITLGITRRNWTLPWLGRDADDLRRNITIKTGPSFKLGFKYYTKNSPELHGFYLMPQFAFRVYEKEFAELDSAGVLNGITHIDRRSINEISLTIGYQHLMLTNNFLLDIYASLGYEERNTQEVFRIDYTGETRYNTKKYVAHGFNPMIGLRLGYGF